MDIAKFIENLQNKPEGTKKVILWVTTAVIMLIIGSGWLASFQAGGTVNMNPSQAQNQGKNNFANIFKSFKKDMASLKKIVPTSINKKESQQPEAVSSESKENQTETKTSKEKKLYKLPLSN